MTLSRLAVLAVLPALALSAAPAAAKPVRLAKNAQRVNGLKASRTPMPGRLLALDRTGKFPASVLPAVAAGQPGQPGQPGPAGPKGDTGPQGPKGETGTVDTSNFFTKGQSDGRYLQLLPASAQALTASSNAATLLLRQSAQENNTTYPSELRLNTSGAFSVGGTLGVGSIPETGCGERMMWHPYKAAFRVGSAGNCDSSGNGVGTWDEGDVGFYSFAAGNMTKASAFGTFAFGDGTTASGVDAAAFGGSNLASGTASFTAGASSKAQGFTSTALGFSNRAAGQGSTAIGYRNGAIGDYSLALGQRAVASSACADNASSCDIPNLDPTSGRIGAFVWGDDSTNNYVTATANNQFTARAAGGFRFFTNAGLTTGCSLPPGSGAFSCTSDRNEKHAFKPVRGRSVLERLQDVPVTTWQYKSEKGGVRHMGPMAQDFHRAFGLGPDDKHIGSIDEDGVNMAAIKELYEITQRQQKQIDQLRRELRNK